MENDPVISASTKVLARELIHHGQAPLPGGRLATIRKVTGPHNTWVDTGSLCYFHDIKYHPETKSWMAFVERPDGTLALIGMDQIRLLDREEWLKYSQA